MQAALYSAVVVEKATAEKGHMYDKYKIIAKSLHDKIAKYMVEKLKWHDALNSATCKGKDLSSVCTKQ